MNSLLKNSDLPGGFDVDLGTSPHGLSAGLPLPGEGLSAVKRSDAVSPGVWRSPKVRSDCRCIREAAAKQAREGAHYLRLNDSEFLWIYSAIEHDRNRTRKAIRNGIADPQDLKATDSV